jgi:hypothetical protein
LKDNPWLVITFCFWAAMKLNSKELAALGVALIVWQVIQKG